MDIPAIPTWLICAAVLFVACAPFLWAYRRRERKTREAELEAEKYGLKEPATLHPIVDPNRCIGIGNCAKVCPEPDVLGMRAGQAIAVAPARCIGHGLCERVCPVDAIQLVFGTATRGVDIPRVKENFETNVPGIYIIGELGGMGLIHAAFEQGRQVIDGISKEKRSGPADALDVLIVGCGPGGLSASLSCLQSKLKFVTIDKEEAIGGAVRHYPRKKLVMTYPVKIPGYGRIRIREIQKEQLIKLWEDVAVKVGLKVNTGETVRDVKRQPGGGFQVITDKATYKTQRVILAIGRRGIPRKLNVPGEDSPKVAYALKEPELYQNDNIVVVGGGDSAVEAALALSEQPGNTVRLSYRKDRFSRIKPMNHQRIESAISQRRIEPLWSTSLRVIEPDAVVYGNGGSDTVRIANDYVFVFIGGELPTNFLKSCGIQIDTKFGQP
jgi:thioredoxin reductase/Pyruvate/2-oxoacid:ferredoxin oxidoreductase delta subunit